MNRAWELAAGISRRHFLAWSAAVGAAGLAGCKSTEATKLQTPRSQIGEDPADPDTVPTVGSKTSVGNTEALTVSGVGLVYNLPGTGSSPATGSWRTMLEDSLKKLKRDQTLNLRELLDGPGRTTSLVIVSAQIPPGAREGDPIDVQVTLPDDSKTTSLRGGELFATELITFDTTGNIRAQVRGPAARGGNQLVAGSVWARAQGPLVAGNIVLDGADGKEAKPDTDAEGRALYRAGFIAGGAKVAHTRPYYLLLNAGDQNPRVGAAIAERLNTTFHTTSDPRFKVADAKDRELVLLSVPAAYRHNHYRFPAGRPPGAVQPGRREQRVPPEARRGADGPGHRAHRGGEARGARRGLPPEPQDRPGERVAVGPVRGRRGARVPGADGRRGRTRPARRGPLGAPRPEPQGARVAGRRRRHRQAGGDADQRRRRTPPGGRSSPCGSPTSGTRRWAGR